MIDLKIYYTVEDDEKRIDSEFDKKIDLIAEEKGLKFLGSGYEFETRIRDLHYSSKK